MQTLWSELVPPYRDDVWQQLAAHVGGRFERIGVWQSPLVRLQHRSWTVVLDLWKHESVRQRGGFYSIRMRSQFLNRDGFWFTVYPEGVISAARKWLGMQDVVVGHEAFDGEFIIQGSDGAKLQALFDNPTIRFALEGQPTVHFSIADSEHSYWGVPEGIDELCLTSSEDIPELASLRLLFELFSATLDELCRLGTIAVEDPLVRF
jgi:hypothetical protein